MKKSRRELSMGMVINRGTFSLEITKLRSSPDLSLYKVKDFLKQGLDLIVETSDMQYQDAF